MKSNLNEPDPPVKIRSSCPKHLTTDIFATDLGDTDRQDFRL